jgi:hypothetical protein
MPIFRQFVERLSPLVPSIWRRRAPVAIDDMGTTTSSNILNLAIVVGYQMLDALGEALVEQSEVTWPLATASGFVLDNHWGPWHGLARNGQTDADYRLYTHAKRMLMRSWGSADQALEIFQFLLPAATVTWTPFYPKNWIVTITGVSLAAAAPAILFMTKQPSPQGGGFSVCGDNGLAVIADPVVFSYSSVYGPVPTSVGWYSSVYGASGSAEAGWAHVAAI